MVGVITDIEFLMSSEQYDLPCFVFASEFIFLTTFARACFIARLRSTE
jgi:hypothetical protein